MQSTASAAGYSTGGTLVSAFAAFVLLNNQQLPLATTLAWVFFLAVLGVTMAIPMKRQMINVEQLRFPSGLAAAETLKALHSHGSKGMRAAIALGVSGVLAALDKFMMEGLATVDGYIRAAKFKLADFSYAPLLDKFNEFAFGQKWMTRTVSFAWDPLFIAAGAISGIRVCISMMIGSVTCWMIFVPLLQNEGIITGTKYREIVAWTLWGGTSCMVSSGLLAFAMQWKSALRAFRGLGDMFGTSSHAKGNDIDSRMAAIETPMSWFVIGQAASLIGLAYLGHTTFGMPYWQSALAVVMSFALALVACRVTGETDTTPVGAMGKITQLTFGVVHPAGAGAGVAEKLTAMNVNLMAANITAGAATSSADLLTDLKSGYLLGAHPRRQFIAQFAGIFAGTIVTVWCFRQLVPDASAIGGDKFPAPAAQTWRAVAEAMSQGLAALEPVKQWSILWGAVVGVALTVLGAVVPEKARKFVPSAGAVGLAWTFHWYYGFAFLLGGIIGWIFEKSAPKRSEEYTFPVASGIIAGNSLMGVTIAFGETLKDRIVGT